MSKKYRRTGPRSRSVLARACASVGLEPLETRVLLSAALAYDWGGIDTAYEAAVDGRGRVIVTGDSDDALLMARFTRTGDELAIDDGFGTDGAVTLEFDPFGIAFQPDGKILLAGDDAEGTVLVARYNEDGTLDETFAGDGTAEFNVAPDALANAIGVQGDGKIVVAGASGDDFLVVRFERNGNLDTSFGLGGYVTTDFDDGGVDEALGLGVLPDGRIAVGGSSDVTNYAIARYLPDGTLDPTLDGADGDGNGRVSGTLQDFDMLDDLPVTDFIALPDGRMFVLGDGTDDPGITDDGVVYPFTPNGEVIWLERDSLFRVGPHDEMAADGYDYVIATSWHDEETTNEGGWHNHDFFAFGERTDFGGDDTDGLEFDEYVLGVALRDGVGAAVGVTGEDWGVFVTDYAPTQGSYTGAAHRPGQTIQAEDFDYGGEGVAYHDSGVTNQGGEYRVGGVDIGYTSDTGGGFAVGWTQPGEWLEYTISVPEDGQYRLETRVANPASGAVFRYQIDGSDVTSGMTVPATDGWHDFATVISDPVQLEAGEHVLRLEMEVPATNGAIANFNWLRFTLVDDGGGGGEPGGGTLDERFGEDGLVDSAVADNVRPVDTAVGPGGEVVAVGGNVVARHLQDGSLDANFGDNGRVDTDFTQIHDVAIQDDGRIVVVGHQNNVFTVARYTTAGQLDASFSGDGVTSRGFGGTSGADVARAVAIQPDGKIVVVGAGTTGRSGAQTALVIARYNASGSIDTSFDNDGYSAELLLPTSNVAYDVEIAPDGKIVVGGVSGSTGVILRYASSGSFDTGFGGGDGIVELDEFRGVGAIEVQEDLKVVFATSQDIPLGGPDEFVPDGVVGRLNADGTSDVGFAQGGSTSFSRTFRREGTTASFVHDLAIDDGGNIIVVGQEEQQDGARSHAVFTVLNPDGSVHEAFDGGGDGFVFVPIDSRSAAEAVAIGDDSSFVIASEYESSRIILARFLPLDDGGGGGEPGGDGTGLTGTYYSNIDFTGSSISRTDAAVNFNWGRGGPSNTIGADTFSARWTGQVEAQKTEQYTFYTRTDDGVRLWVDGQLVVDQWVPQSATEHSGTIELVAGQRYEIRMEYFERYGQAVAELRWSSPTTPKELVSSSQLFPSNPGPADTQEPSAPTNLRATPTHRQVVLDWDPAGDNVGVTSYEVLRKEQRIATLPGNELNYVDGDLQPNTTYLYRVIAIDAAGNRSDPAAVITVTPPAPTSGGLQAIFYDNMDFTDEDLRRSDVVVDFDWGRGTPDLSIQPDTFSVRFFGHVTPAKTERYTFYTNSDDGVRLKVNGVTLIDKLVPQSATEWSGSIDLEAGKSYTIALEYFERLGEAKVQLFWSSPTTPKQMVPAANLSSWRGQPAAAGASGIAFAGAYGKVRGSQIDLFLERRRDMAWVCTTTCRSRLGSAC